MNQLLSLLLIGSLLLLITFTLTWAWQLRTGNAAIVDTVWSASFPMLAMAYFILVDGYAPRQLLILLMVVIWGMRLALYLLSRTVGQPEDARYTALRKEWGINQNVLMLRFFYFQAALALALSVPFALINLNTDPSLKFIEWVGAGIWLIGLLGESLSDYQLKIFKSKQENKGKVCDDGLWYYSRHPNYFFEWLIWVAYFVMALGSAWGWLTFFCPLLMLYFLLKVTGIGYTEAQLLKSKGEAYIKYQKTTSAFVPLPKREA
jgi:steroid 5-alpha reductase family enzyme